MIAKEQLEELYIKQNKLRREIAEELNVPISQVDFYLNKYHIKKNSRKIRKSLSNLWQALFCFTYV